MTVIPARFPSARAIRTPGISKRNNPGGIRVWNQSLRIVENDKKSLRVPASTAHHRIIMARNSMANLS
jgi:hypothetical protein